MRISRARSLLLVPLAAWSIVVAVPCTAQAGLMVDPGFHPDARVQGVVAVGPDGPIGQVGRELRRLLPTGALDPVFAAIPVSSGTRVDVDEAGRLYVTSIDAGTLVVRRYRSDGAADGTWGTGGSSARELRCGESMVGPVAVHVDGGIDVVVTRVVRGGAPRNPIELHYPALARFDAAGAVRPALSDPTLEPSRCTEVIRYELSVWPLPGGGVVAMDGQGTRAFAADGRTSWADRTASRLAGVTADGRLLGLRGASPAHWGWINVDGSVGPTVELTGRPVAVQPDGSIVTSSLREGGVELRRQHADGAFDETFGDVGSTIACARSGVAGYRTSIVDDATLIGRDRDAWYVRVSVVPPGGGFDRGSEVLRIVERSAPVRAPTALIWSISDSGWSLRSEESTIYVGARTRLWLTGRGCDGPGVASMSARWRGVTTDAAAFGARRSLEEGAGTFEVDATDRAGAVGTTRRRMVVDYEAPVLVVRRVGRTVQWEARDRGSAGSSDRGAVRLPPTRACRQSFVGIADRAGNATRVVLRWNGWRLRLIRDPRVVRHAQFATVHADGWSRCPRPARQAGV